MTGTDNAAVNTSGAANSMGVCYSFVFCFFPTNLLAWDGFADGAAGASRLWLFAGAVTFNYAYKRETVLDVLPAGRGLLQLPMLLAGQSGCQHKWATPETQLGSARLGSARLGSVQNVSRILRKIWLTVREASRAVNTQKQHKTRQREPRSQEKSGKTINRWSLNDDRASKIVH